MINWIEENGHSFRISLVCGISYPLGMNNALALFSPLPRLTWILDSFSLYECQLMFICSMHTGCALVPGQTMVKGRVGFMLAIVMKQLNKREW